MNRPFVRLCPCGCRRYGVWAKKWPETWEGSYPREGLIHFYAFLREAMDRAFQEASAEGARRLKAALITHARIGAAKTSTYRSPW
jgi:hypothetical protein